MSKIDKQIEKLGYSVYQIDRADVKLASDLNTPITFLEYVRKSSENYYARTEKELMSVTVTDYNYVEIFCTNLESGRFSIRVSYETDNKPSALGGDREYGTSVRSMPVEELDIFLKKARQLQRKLKRHQRLLKIFKRG